MIMGPQYIKKLLFETPSLNDSVGSCVIATRS